MKTKSKMKKKFLIYFLLCSVISFSQKKDTIPVVLSKTLTAIGKVIGDSVSKTIGTEGGKIVSPDGKMELIIPANALLSKINISITPVENLAPGGSVGAYKLEPSGIKFQQAAQIIFHYKDSDYNGSNQNLQSIAFQDAQGQWYQLKNVLIDTVQKTIAGSLTHFSVWAAFDYAQIIPHSARVRVGEKQSLSIVVNWPNGDPNVNSSRGDNDDDLLSPPSPSTLVIVWQVNSVPGGDAADGIITGNNSGAEYTAPNSIPERNPVAITAEAAANLIIGSTTFHDLKLVSNITVYDGWHYTFIGYSSKGCFRMIDSSSCDIRVENNQVIVSNIVNHKPWSDWPQCDAPTCTIEWTNKDTWKGLVEIGGAASTRFTGASENGPSKIYISLVPAYGNTPSAKETCPKDKRTIPSMPMPAMPNYISFDIIGSDDVVIHYGSKSGTNVLNSVVNGDGFIIRVTK